MKVSNNTSRNDQRVLERFREYLRSRGYSVTAPRRTVLNEIAHMGGHFGVEELASRLQHRRQPVSRATVYRTVGLLENAGIIRRLDLDEPHAYYESTVGAKHHEHLVCTRCGKVAEVSDRTLEHRIERIAQDYQFRLTKHTVQLVGICRECYEQRIRAR